MEVRYVGAEGVRQEGGPCMTYYVGNDRLPADTAKDAVVVAAAIIKGYPVGYRVRIRQERSLYAWVEYRPSIVDKRPHLVYYTPRTKFGKPVSSHGKVLFTGTKWSKDKKQGEVVYL